MPLTLAVAGMVGAGKSTLARALAHRLRYRLALESAGDDGAAGDGDAAPAANPWLPLFYDRGEEETKRRYALPLQLHFLATRFAALREMRRRGEPWVLDRTWYEDAEVFARGLWEDGYLTALEHDLYARLYAELLHAPAARPPRLLVYLHAPFEVIVERIRRRGREKERDTPLDYWRRLYDRYERWIAGFDQCPVLRVDAREYDLEHDVRSLDEVVARVAAVFG